MRKLFSIFLLILILILSLPLVAMSKNQFKLIKLDSQFEDFENRFALQHSVVDQSKKIVHSWGSGNYCIYEVERTYNYVPSKQEKLDMLLFAFAPTSVRADGQNAKFSISQKGSQLRVYVEDGPWDNVFDPRCG